MKIEPVVLSYLRKSQSSERRLSCSAPAGRKAQHVRRIAKHKIDGTSLGRHSSLPNAYTFMPIEDWHADDVWEYLECSMPVGRV